MNSVPRVRIELQFEAVSLSCALFNSVYVMRQPDGIWLVGYNLQCVELRCHCSAPRVVAVALQDLEASHAHASTSEVENRAPSSWQMKLERPAETCMHAGNPLAGNPHARTEHCNPTN